MGAVAVPRKPVVGFYLLAVLALGGVVKRIPDGGRILSGVGIEERYSSHGASPAGWPVRSGRPKVYDLSAAGEAWALWLAR
jgi:hypothetical protein